MPTIDIEVNGRAYRLVCEAGQENRIRELAAYVENRLLELTGGGRAGSDASNLLVTCIVLADEMQDVVSGRDVLAERGIVSSGERQQKAEDLAKTVECLADRIEEVAGRLERA